MKVENAVYPNEEQMKGFTKGDHGEPISMVNLLKFRKKAEYPDGRETDLTGAEAYAIYGLGVSKLVADLGGRMVFQALSNAWRWARLKSFGTGGDCPISEPQSHARHDDVTGLCRNCAAPRCRACRTAEY